MNELERLRQWKAEASEVMMGLQDVGKALGIRPGVSITGPEAVKAARALREARDGIAAFADELDATRMAGCKACREPEYAAKHAHDCAVTSEEVAASLRNILRGTS